MCVCVLSDRVCVRVCVGVVIICFRDVELRGRKRGNLFSSMFVSFCQRRASSSGTVGSTAHICSLAGPGAIQVRKEKKSSPPFSSFPPSLSPHIPVFFVVVVVVVAMYKNAKTKNNSRVYNKQQTTTTNNNSRQQQTITNNNKNKTLLIGFDLFFLPYYQRRVGRGGRRRRRRTAPRCATTGPYLHRRAAARCKGKCGRRREINRQQITTPKKTSRARGAQDCNARDRSRCVPMLWLVHT